MLLINLKEVKNRFLRTSQNKIVDKVICYLLKAPIIGQFK